MGDVVAKRLGVEGLLGSGMMWLNFALAVMVGVHVVLAVEVDRGRLAKRQEVCVFQPGSSPPVSLHFPFGHIPS